MGNRTLPLQNVTAPRSTKRTIDRKPTPKHSSLRFLLHFVQRHPFICLLAVWSSFLFFGWLAITGLTYINPAPLEVVATPQPSAESQPTTPFELSKPANTFGLLAIVTVTCAASSVLLARQLRPVKPAPRRAIKRQPAPTMEALRSPRSPKPIAKPHPPTVKPTIAVKPRPPVVAVLTEDETPLEIGNATLADMLDIRQQVRK